MSAGVAVIPSNKLVELGFRGVLNALVLCSYSANNRRRQEDRKVLEKLIYKE